MAEGDAPVEGAKHAGSFVTQKVGPLPLWVWGVAALGVWYYFQRQSSSSSAATNAAATNQATDPAGNIGTIDPATGYVFGTPEDTAALASNNATDTTGTGTSSGGSTPGTTYATNNAWAEAAINYLVGLGIDPTTANEAIQQYLASQTLTPAQQGMVNEAIIALGPPPDLPGPIGTPPTPIVTSPPPGTVYATNPPTGLSVGTKTPTTVGLSWNKATNATSYDVWIGTSATSQRGETSAPSTQTGITIGDLLPNTQYFFRVTAQPAAAGAAYASTSAATPKATTTSPVPAPKPPPGAPVPKAPAKTYTVKAGDNLTAIATALGYPGGWQALYAKNKAVIGSNPNLIYPGQVLTL
jgi:LysM repeat protein